MPIARLIAAGSVAVLVSGPALAQDQDFENQLKARQGQFRIMALNLGVLGGMARGNMEYDADLAQQAAQNLVAVASLHQTAVWPEGSDSMSMEGTRAEPTIWDDPDDFTAKWAAFGQAAAGLQDAVATGPEALGPAVGQVGNACKDCHEAHRTPDE